MKTMLRWSRLRRSASRLRICAWIETSSALTGSSAIRTSGSPQARARCRSAAAGRPRSPRDSGSTASGREPDLVEQNLHAPRDLVAAAPGRGPAAPRAGRTRPSCAGSATSRDPGTPPGCAPQEAELAAAAPRRSIAVEEHPARVGPLEEREAARERRLARAALADDARPTRRARPRARHRPAPAVRARRGGPPEPPARCTYVLVSARPPGSI